MTDTDSTIYERSKQGRESREFMREVYARAGRRRFKAMLRRIDTDTDAAMGDDEEQEPREQRA